MEGKAEQAALVGAVRVSGGQAVDVEERRG
jgi:hypothetical protein